MKYFINQYQWIFALILCIALPFTILDNPLRYQLAITSFMMASIGISLGTFAKLTHKISFGHGLFYMFGMFIPLVLMESFNFSPWVALISTIPFSITISFIVYNILHKTNYYWFGILTFLLYFSIIQIINYYTQQDISLSMGYIIPMLSFGNIDIHQEKQWYSISIFLFIFSSIIHQSYLRYIDKQKSRLQFYDPQMHYRQALIAFIFSGTLTGFVGALMSFYLGFVNMNDLSIIKSLEIAWITITSGFGHMLSIIIMSFISENLLAEYAFTSYVNWLFGFLAFSSFIILIKQSKKKRTLF